MGSREASTQSRTDTVAGEVVTGAGVVNGNCSRDSHMLEGSSSSASANHSYAVLRERGRYRRPPKGRNTDYYCVTDTGSSQRYESQNVARNIYNGNGTGGRPATREAGSGRFQPGRPPRQEHQNGGTQERKSDTQHETTCEPFRPRRTVRNTRPPRLQRAYNNDRFQDENSQQRSRDWYSQGGARQTKHASVKEQYSNSPNKDVTRQIVPGNTRQPIINQQSYQVAKKELSEPHEDWRRQSDHGAYRGQEKPLRGFRWRGRGRGYGRGGRSHMENPVERLTLVQNEFEQDIPDETKQEETVVELPRKELTAEELSQLRTTEINLFKKRFPRAKENSEDSFEFVFSPSDPDWPFDVRHLNLKVCFPLKYPSDPLNVTVINPDEVLPSTLVEDTDSAIEKWIAFFHKTGQLCFRPFLRWIDRNLQEVFVESLRKIKRLQIQNALILVDPKQSQLSSATDTEERHQQTETQVVSIEESTILKALPKKHERLLELEEGLDAVGGSKPECSTKVAYQGAVNSNQLAKILNNYDPHSATRKGIEIKFRHVDLSESVSFLVCDRLLVSVQCKKCKKIADFQLLPGRRSVNSCAKCQTKLEACFRPGILLQFNPVLGYLELEDCTIRDVALPRCHFYADCQGCSKLSPLEGVHMGQRASSNCLTCSVKMQLIVDSIKYMDMCSVEANIKASQLKKANKDSAIQAGKPLPNKGICKHYKKSFRWFRFPCCGKAYACDDCHNEQESDHTAEFASRMICGFCAKEQPFSNDKPCSQCSNFITGRRTAHWEGGKGCRNKTKMCSNDAKKYSGLNKTISRKTTTAKSK